MMNVNINVNDSAGADIDFDFDFNADVVPPLLQLYAFRTGFTSSGN